MAGISVATLGSIFTSIENSIKTSLPSFAGFGGTITQDIGSAVVDAETLGGAVLAAFTAAGNPEAAVVAPVVSIAEAFGNGLLGIFGIVPGAPLTIGPKTTAAIATVGQVAGSVATAATAAGSTGVVNSTAAATVGAVATGLSGVADAIDGLGDSKSDTGAL